MTFFLVPRELLGERDAHVVAVVVDDETALAGHLLALEHELLGRELPGEAGVAPGIVSCVQPLSPSVAQYAPVAMTTISAPYSFTPCASSRVFGTNSTFLSLSIWILR